MRCLDAALFDPAPLQTVLALSLKNGLMNPPPPAVANAVYDAIGIQITDLPITAEKIYLALREKRMRFDPVIYSPWLFRRSEHRRSRRV